MSGAEDAARDRLLEELRRLSGRMAAAGETAASILMDPCVPGRAPPLRQLEDQRMLAGLQERDRARLRALVEALRRLEEGRWGVCEACGGPVEPGRLELLPEAATCAACAVGG